jgi:signal transduction histidine kinase/DNA-binding response OmpR family regulator/streptogramin lyase
MKIRRLSFILLFFASAFFSPAQANYKFRTVSPEGGLCSDGVSDICQDQDGFIWILMDIDLYRFDGYQYKRYYSRFTELNPRKEWIFRSIVADSSGRFFVNTNNGLYVYDKTSDTFYCAWAEAFERVEIDTRNRIWVNQDASWHLLDVNRQTLTASLYNGESSMAPVLCLDDNDIYVFGNGGEIYRYNDSKNEFTFSMRLPENNTRVISAKACKGKLWALVQEHGLYKIDLSTRTVEDRFDFFQKQDDTSVRSLYIDKKGDIWLGTINGVYVFDPQKQTYKHYIHSAHDCFSLPNNSIWTINEDRQRNIWIGAYSGKVCYVNLDEKMPFTTYFHREHGLNHKTVSAFAEDDRYLWIGTEGGGVNCLDKQSGQFTYYTHRKNRNSLSFNNIKSLLVDKQRNLWVAMYIGGLDCYNPATGQFRHFARNASEPAQDDSQSLLYNNIRKIVLEADSGLWIAYQHKKLVVSFYSFRNKNFTHYHFNDGNKDFYIFDMLRGRDDQLWILSNEKLYLMDVKSRSIREVLKDNPVFMNFHTFCLDDSGCLWIGTLGNGLAGYRPDTGNYFFCNDLLEYGASSIYNICNDDKGNIWLGTDNGLICYNTATGTFSRYTENDGAQGRVYYPLASLKGMNGKLYVGGTNGFTVIKPQEVSHNTYQPRIIIADFFIDNASSRVTFFAGDSSRLEKVIRLDHNQTNFGFMLSSDNYLMSEKNRFKYRLRNYDDRWIEVDAFNRTALYSKAPPGVYYFEALASNNDGVWSATPTVVKILRKPAPWLSAPAYTLYGVIVLSVLFIIIRYYRAKRKLEFRLCLEKIEKNKKEEIHQSQLRFFTDISHDFRTPLSLISATLYRLRNEGLKEYYYNLLNSNTQRLLNLLNELMDFRTVENGKMHLELQEVAINAFVDKIASDFREYAGQRRIDFQIRLNEQLATVYIDRNKVEKIIMNLLNNAFKYTKEGGAVSIELHAGHSFQSDYTANYVIKGDDCPVNEFSVVIRDTGAGISKELITNVFERFYKTDTASADPQLGNGIGLALVKSFVLLHKGVLTIASEKNRGTDIEVSFSLDKSTYDDADFSSLPEDVHQQLNKSGIEHVLKNDKKRILLAEDNNDLRRLIAAFLSEEYEVVQAEDGQIASRLLSERVIELIISDIMMPEKDGIAFCSETKNNIETSHIPFILLTAKTGIESKIEGAGSGADIYLEKPIDFNLLKLTIQNVFNQQQQLKEYYAKNYFVDTAGLSSNEKDNKFLKNFVHIIEANIDQPDLDVNYIASELSMSRSKLYNKIKMMTGKSIVEFVLSQRLRKAARLIIEKDLSMRQVMDEVGIESQAYFTNAFKKEFGETPSAFAAKHKSPSAKGCYKKVAQRNTEETERETES